MFVTSSGITVFLHPAIRVLVAVSMIALQFFLLSYTVFLSSTFMLINPVQSRNAFSPMLVTLSGIVMFVKPVQQ